MARCLCSYTDCSKNLIAARLRGCAASRSAGSPLSLTPVILVAAGENQ